MYFIFLPKRGRSGISMFLLWENVSYCIIMLVLDLILRIGQEEKRVWLGWVATHI